jgi:hypothetical protein
MNNNDLAALAALGAMGYMYKRHLDGQGAGTEAAPADAVAAKERFAPFSEVGTGGAGGLPADAKRDIRMGGFDNTREDIKRSDMDDFKGVSQYRYIDQPRNNRSGIGGKGGGAGAGADVGSGYTDVVPGSELGSQGNFRLSTPDAAPEESGGMGGALRAGIGAAGLGAAGLAGSYYARLKAQARAMNPRAQTDELSDAKKAALAGPDRSPRPITGDLSETQKKFAEGPDRAAIAEAKSKAIQAEIDSELKRLKSKTKGADARAGVSKAAFAAGPTVTSASTTAPTENAARMTAAKKAAAKQAAAMEEFNKMLRESKVGPAAEESKRVKARGGAGKVGAALTALGLGTAANAATDMTAGERERLGKDVLEGLIMPLGLTPGMAGEGSELYPSKPLSSAERKKNLETFLANASPADKKKYEEAMARQNPGLFDKIKRPSAANQRAGGGQIKTKRMASGGMTSTVSSASKRGDGIASKGKTRCKMY